MIDKLALVALGGACGASLRYLGVTLFTRVAGDPAFGTLFVNIAGSFAMGFVVVLLGERLPEPATRMIPFLATGLLGGFTTFSAFSLDTIRLMESGKTGLAIAYVLASVFISILALGAGLWIGRTSL